MTEKELQTAVIDLAKLLGWRVMHQRPARRLDGTWRTAIEGDVGFPDLVLLRPPVLIFAELKSARGNPDFAQSTWLNGLDTVSGVQTFLWRPLDWTDGRIEDVLR